MEMGTGKKPWTKPTRTEELVEKIANRTQKGFFLPLHSWIRLDKT